MRAVATLAKITIVKEVCCLSSLIIIQILMNVRTVHVNTTVPTQWDPSCAPAQQITS